MPQQSGHPAFGILSTFVIRISSFLAESSWSSLECSLACHARDRGFKSRRGRFGDCPLRCSPKNMTARYANRQSGEAQTFVHAGSTPACATVDYSRLRPTMSIRHSFVIRHSDFVIYLRGCVPTAACKAVVKKQVRRMTRGSIPSQPIWLSRAGTAKARPVRLSDRTPASQAGKASSIPARAAEHDQVAELVDARCSERRARAPTRSVGRHGSSTLPLVTQESPLSLWERVRVRASGGGTL